MTFEMMGRGFENGPTERYEFDMPLHVTQGPSWSTDTLVEIKVFKSTPRCRSIHPSHDCQCTGEMGHRGGWQSRHHCWHDKDWPAWRRGKRDLMQGELVVRSLLITRRVRLMSNKPTWWKHSRHRHPQRRGSKKQRRRGL